MDSNTSANQQRRIGLAILVLLFIFLYGRYLAGFAPSGGDLVNNYLPCQQLIRSAIRQGQAPLWNSFTFCGRPLMADIQVGVLYPPNWLHWILPLPVSFALVLALHGIWMLAGCWRLGRHWRLDPAGIALGTVLFCACPFFTLKSSQGIVLFIYVGAWWPWLALAVSRLVQRPGFGRMSALALALSLSLLAGATQITFYGWLMALALGIVLPPKPGAAPPARRWLKQCAWLVAAFVLALGLTAIQTAQTYSFISTSFERGAGANWDYITDGSLAPRLLWLLVNPGFLGVGSSEGALYWGSQTDFAESCFYAPLWVLAILAPLALPAWLAMRRGTPGVSSPAFVTSNNEEGGADEGRTALMHRRLLLLSAVGMVLGLCLALGGYSPLFKVFYHFVPGFNRFRVPARLMFFFSAGEALLAALVFHELLGRAGSMANKFVGRGLVAVGGAAALAAVWGSWAMRVPLWEALGNPAFQGSMIANLDAYEQMSRHALHLGLGVTVGTVCAGAAAWALLGDRKWIRSPKLRQWLPWALPLLALVELASLAFPFQKNTGVGDFNKTFYPRTELVQTLQREHRGGRVLWLDNVIAWQVDQNQPEIYPNRLVMQGLPEVRGYDPVNARWIGAWMNLLAGRDPNENPRGFMFIPKIARPAWLELMAVETVVSYSDLSQIPGLRVAGQFQFPEGTLTVWRNERYRGLAFPAPMPKLARSAVEALVSSARLAENPAARPEDVIVADGPLIAEAAARQPLAKAIDERFKVTPLPSGPNGFRYQVYYPEAALLVLSQSAYGGWSASIDKKLAPLSYLSGAFQAVVVPPGPHEVSFEFQPDLFVLGRTISLVALVALVYGLIRSRVMRRRKARA